MTTELERVLPGAPDARITSTGRVRGVVDWRAVRRALGYTQDGMAAACGLAGRATVCQWEAGTHAPSRAALMSLYAHLRARSRRLAREARAFTLVELLVVLAIVAAISGIVAAGYRSTRGADAAARMVVQQLYAARQYAVSQRCHVAVLMPDANTTPAHAAAYYGGEYYGRAMRPVVVTSNRRFARYISGSGWAMVPGRASVALDGTPTMVTRDSSNPTPNIVMHTGGFECDTVRAIAFRPSGSLYVDTTGDVTMTVAGGGHSYLVTVGWLTGRTSVTRQ